MRPLLARRILVQFYTVLVRIAQVKGLTHSLIGRAIREIRALALEEIRLRDW